MKIVKNINIIFFCIMLVLIGLMGTTKAVETEITNENFVEIETKENSEMSKEEKSNQDTNLIQDKDLEDEIEQNIERYQIIDIVIDSNKNLNVNTTKNEVQEKKEYKEQEQKQIVPQSNNIEKTDFVTIKKISSNTGNTELKSEAVVEGFRFQVNEKNGIFSIIILSIIIILMIVIGLYGRKLK